MNHSIFVTSMTSALVLAALSLGVGACGSSAAETPAAVAQSAATTAPVAPNAHGPVKLIGEALGQVALRPDQRAELEKLAADAEARHAGMKTDRDLLLEAVADQVESGTIDRAALAPKIDATVAGLQKVQPADRAAFERVHAILDPAQRAKFVEALEAKMHEGREGHVVKGRMFALAGDLGLSDEQKAKIKETLLTERRGAPHEHQRGEWGHGRAAKVMEAFKGDRFVLDEVAPQVDLKDKATHGTEKILAVAEKVLPILSPVQRKIAADKIRERASAPVGDEPLPLK